ncbi:unnamed protein product [Lasius platythorax]|uniref:Uncharacterized protein n=1 Tax=Lasius platythorax TaxID=488582 RepID=A0AAV2NGF2_9HYME
MVQITKRSLKQLDEGDWKVKLARLLLKQHTTPSTTTGKTPVALMFYRKIRTTLDNMLPKKDDNLEENLEKYQNIRKINPGSHIRLRRYRIDGPEMDNCDSYRTHW